MSTKTLSISQPAPAALASPLRGISLLVLRALWLTLALMILALTVLSLPQAPASFLTPAVRAELARLGMSLELFVALNIGMVAVCLSLYLVVAVVIFLRRSTDRMAYFCSLMLLLFGGMLFGFVQEAPPQTVPGWLWNTLAGGLGMLAQALFFIFFYVFPNGRFVPKWTRWAVVLNVVYWLVKLVVPAFDPLTFATLFFAMTALITQIYRYRKVSTHSERQQTKWVVFGFTVAVAAARHR